MLPISASLFEWMQAVAGVVAALAALVTLVFAWLTVRGAQELGRAQRRAHLLDLAADVDESGVREMFASTDDRSAWRDARTARHQFRAALDATGERMPACRAVLEVDRLPVPMGAAERRLAESDEALKAALDELAASLHD